MEETTQTALATIVVLAPALGGVLLLGFRRSLQPWAGAVKVAAANLAGQYRSIDMRKVTEQDAIYYIGEFAVSNQETLVFDIDVVPENETRRLAVRFTKQFYTK